jgi:hypothetical protein
MVDKVNEITAYQQVYPNLTMDPEWDALAEIRGTIQALDTNLKPDTNWIKGHQDKDTPYDELPLQAQLNCDADALAEEYLREAIIDFTKMPIMPTSGCQLHLPQGTITHGIKRELKFARSVPPLKEKLKLKHCWSDEEIDDINWAAHGRALRRHDKRRETMVKYLNDILPLGKRDPKYPPTCPSCPAPIEDQDHFWNCPATSRNEWRKQCRTSILDILTKTDTAPPLQ